MAFLSSLDISGSALTANRLRMDVISENLSNQNTTRTEEGGPYRRKLTVFQSADRQLSFREMFKRGLNRGAVQTKGVKVTEIIEDETEFTPVYNPDHPDANEEGYVLMPNVDPLKETLDMMAATRAYDANVTAFNAVKDMALRALEIGK